MVTAGYKVNMAHIYLVSGLQLLLVFVMILLLLMLSLCVFHFKKSHFLLESGGANPYSLVYRVTKFACKHKVPIQLSVFTFCDEERPSSRMDVAKQKYGGPFTTEQVEDVKAFWGMLKVLLLLGPVCMLQSVAQSSLPVFAKRGSNVMYVLNSSNTNSSLMAYSHPR